jgi:XTP/dITP diphosphohydrolase
MSAGELGLPEPEETGTSFRANAKIKALAASQRSGQAAFADDSGIAIDALDGEPGIHSARWAGPGKDFRAAMNEVQTRLMKVGAKAPERRRAHFVSALCVAWPDGHVEEFEAKVDGTVVWPPRGTQGFGYDPLFLPDGQTRTFGEMSAEEKHGLPPHGRGLSHRARAFLKLAGACLGKR